MSFFDITFWSIPFIRVDCGMGGTLSPSIYFGIVPWYLITHYLAIHVINKPTTVYLAAIVL